MQSQVSLWYVRAMKAKKRRPTPNIMKECVAKVVPKMRKKLGKRRGTGAAFAICTKTLTDSGQMQPGTRKLTPKGAGKSSALLRKKSRRAVAKDFDAALSRPNPKRPVKAKKAPKGKGRPSARPPWRG